MNSVVKKLKKYLLDSNYRFMVNASKGVYNSMPDREYLEKMFKVRMGYDLNLDNPVTFNEKLQWLKLNNRQDIYSRMVDKYTAKQYAAEQIDEKYVIPTLGVWNDFDEIDFDKLPNQFVLKTTHDSGGVVICRDKSKLDIAAARKKINKSMKNNYYLHAREWPYKNVKPRIIAEEYLSILESGKELIEYKFFCFNGEPQLVLVCKGTAHGNGRTNDFYDLDFNHLDVKLTYPNAAEKCEKPKEIDEMLEVARKLSFGIPHLRVDLYIANGKVYFGETTFFHDSGFCKFDPPEWDRRFGNMLKLPIEKV